MCLVQETPKLHIGDYEANKELHAVKVNYFKRQFFFDNELYHYFNQFKIPAKSFQDDFFIVVV